MGAWGEKLYDSDVACDVRDAFKDLARLPVEADRLVELALARHPSASDPADEDHTAFWLALADQLHRYGIAHPPTFERAFAIVDHGVDDALMAALDMSPADRGRRAKALAAQRSAWASPHPKPTTRRVLAAPERHEVEPGEIWAYPTMGGNPPNTYFSQAMIDERFHPDGWNAFAIGAVGHQLGYFALAYFLRLHVDSPDRPDLDTCRRAPISGIKYFLASHEAPLAHAVAWGTVTKSVLRKMRAERLGKVELSWERIRAQLNGTDGLSASRRGRISSYLDIYQPGLGKDEYVAPLSIRLSDLLA